MRPGRPRLKEVAAAVGVSPDAVSKALRDAPDISEATKARVRREAARLGYVPNGAARWLRTGVGGALGFLAPDLAGPGVPEMLRGLERVAGQAGLTVAVACGGGRGEEEWAGFRRLLVGQATRLVIVGSTGGGQRSPLLREASARGVPLVYVNLFPAAAPQYENVGRVAADWSGAGRMAVEAVASRGHRRLGYLAGWVSGSAWAEHFQGVMAAAEGAGFPAVHTVFADPDSTKAGWAGAREVLAGTPEVTAILCAGDRMAQGAMAALKALGRDREVAVVGCGGAGGSEGVEARLATVRIPWERLGERAGERLTGGQVSGEERLAVEWLDGPSLFPVR